MIFAPKPLGNLRLSPDALAEDKKNCRRIGPCGIGEKAIYLNSFLIDRRFYVTYTDVRRVFKRIAMSRGGYTGKGIFGSIPYLVCQLSNGREISCNFKYEQDVDTFLAVIQKEHPEIPVHSRAAQEKLERARREEEAKYLKELPEQAADAVRSLRSAKAYLEKKPEIGNMLSECAKRKRSVDGVKRGNLVMAWTIFLGSVILAIAGVAALLAGQGSWPAYLVLFGFAGILFVSAAGILPTGRRNRKAVQKDWDDAVAEAAAYTKDYGNFPVPPQYAHPVVLERMIRLIRQGKADGTDDAFEKMKEELKSLDHTKTVTQAEYDEIVAVKPMFRVMNYQ